MCGIVGVIGQLQVNQTIFDALTMIQHRGQDAAGIMTMHNDRLFLRKSSGLVRDVIRQRHMQRLQGTVGLGHVRYPTAGTDSAMESQPFYVNSPYGLSLVHNGNLTNSRALTEALHQTDLRHLNTASDSEVLLNVLAFELAKVAKTDLTVEALATALRRLYARVEGAFSAIAMINGYGLVAFRDANGIRPLVYGRRKTASGYEYMVASESIVLDALGYERVADVQPGQAIYIDMNQQIHFMTCVDKAHSHPCLFEFIYLARPDSIIDNICVYRARLAMGQRLARRIQQVQPNHPIDVVIPIPDTSRTAALAVAQTLGLRYCEGFVKNRYIGRTFIMPDQTQRRNTVRMKLNAIRDEFVGQHVLLIDDSIVRGTTSKEIVAMAYDAGAASVAFASAAPMVTHPNVYGIDMPCISELIAHGRSEEEIAQIIGADWLVYQSLSDAYDAVNSAAKSEDDVIARFEDSVFTGDYVTGGISSAYLKQLSLSRSDQKNDHARIASGDDLVINVDDQ